MKNNVILEVHGIVKHFPGVLANDHIDFDLRAGEVHALLGENGAGKSTLMNIINGLYSPDEGEIFINGEKVEFHSPKDSIALGVDMVHQHFMLIPVFTVTENIMLGDESTRLGLLDKRSVAKKVTRLSHQYGLDIDPDALVNNLPVGVQQRVEIVKTLYRNAKILILDEPTAVLTPQEVEDLFRVINELKSQGVSIVFISHKLKEVLSIADRITVMRAGRVVGTVLPAETNQSELATMMVGREVLLTVQKDKATPGDDVLSINDLYVHDFRGLEVVKGVTLTVRSGEILGIAGVQGNGQTELVEALTGLRPSSHGNVWLDTKEITNCPPRVVTESGSAHIPEDRQRHGLVLSYPVADNLVLCTYYQTPFARASVLQQEVVDQNARKLIKEFDIRTPSPYVPAGKLSGGNQQKVIVARELSRKVKLIIANQPTRGLDVGSIEYIHHEIISMRDRGVAVLLISAELDEIMSLADRIAVMYRGQIVDILDVETATRDQLGLLMAGSIAESEKI